VAFLTVVPVRLREPVASIGAAAAWFPAVGAGLGALAGVVTWAAAPALGPAVAGVLGVGVLVIATGALHVDGLADCADGLGVRGDRARRLAVMRDSTIGTYGAVAVGLWLALMVAALAGLDREAALRALVVAAALGRLAAVVHGMATPPARRDGLGAGFSPPPAALVLAGATGVACALLLAGPADGGRAVLAALLVAAGSVAWARRAVGGRTGDTLGATVALAEAAVLVTLLAAS
jgi:adenosylcobinamide-GDP ribazoletransferase